MRRESRHFGHKVSAWEKNRRARSRLGRGGEKCGAPTCENAGGRARANRRVSPKTGRCARMRAIRCPESPISPKPGRCSIHLAQCHGLGEASPGHGKRARKKDHEGQNSSVPRLPNGGQNDAANQGPSAPHVGRPRICACQPWARTLIESAAPRIRTAAAQAPAHTRVQPPTS